MKKIITKALAIYLLASLLISVAYNVTNVGWKIATNRYGLLCVGIDNQGVWVLSPFTNYADVFLFGVDFDDDGIHTYSDGFDSFGEYAI